MSYFLIINFNQIISFFLIIYHPIVTNLSLKISSESENSGKQAGKAVDVNGISFVNSITAISLPVKLPTLNKL